MYYLNLLTIERGTAEQLEDLKFKLKKAVFSTTTTATITLANKELPTKTLALILLEHLTAQKILEFSIKITEYINTSDNVTIGGISSGTYNGIAHSDINGTYTSISNITLDSYDITSGSSSNASTGDVGGSSVTATQNRLYDVIQLQIGKLKFTRHFFNINY